jgi:hypothetical protein
LAPGIFSAIRLALLNGVALSSSPTTINVDPLVA